MKLFIKNMVCPRCIQSVEKVMEEMDFAYQESGLGWVKVSNNIQKNQLKKLSRQLGSIGLVLLDKKEEILANQVKSFIIEKVHFQKHESPYNFAETISKHLGKSYTTLSKVFRKVEGQTIEQFMIHQKIERVKELISYGELTLSEIAFDMQYSSVAHLSAQFKKVTGMTPTTFRKDAQARSFIDKL